MLSTVDLLVLTSLDQLILILKIVFTVVTKQAVLMRRSAVLILPLQLVFPGYTMEKFVLSQWVLRMQNIFFSSLKPTSLTQILPQCKCTLRFKNLA